MLQGKKLNKTEISKLEQNYIHSDSASFAFVTKMESLYTRYIENSVSELKEYSGDLQEIYDLASEINPAALPYAQLTTLIFMNDANEEATGYFIKFLENFYIETFNLKKTNDQLTEGDEIAISALAKTKEHLSLAFNQKNNLYNEQKEKLRTLEAGLLNEQRTLQTLKNDNNTYEGEINKITNSIKQLDTKLDEAQTKAEENENKYNKMTMDFLSMMGIFSTIIFAVFGGLSQIGAIGDNLAETPISKILMYISLSAITLILIVFISFNAISKLTGLKLRSCKCKDEDNCTCNVLKLHPTLSFSLFLFVDLFFFSLILRAMSYPDWIDSLNDILIWPTNLGAVVKIILVLAFCTINGMTCYHLIKYLKKKQPLADVHPKS